MSVGRAGNKFYYVCYKHIMFIDIFLQRMGPFVHNFLSGNFLAPVPASFSEIFFRFFELAATKGSVDRLRVTTSAVLIVNRWSRCHAHALWITNLHVPSICVCLWKIHSFCSLGWLNGDDFERSFTGLGWISPLTSKWDLQLAIWIIRVVTVRCPHFHTKIFHPS